MFPVSDEFLSRIRHTHTATFRAEVAPNFGSFERVPLEILSGSVTNDRSRDIRRTAEINLVDNTGELTPTDAQDLLAPYGSELYLHRGVVLLNGDVEEVPLGVFRITDFDVSYTQDGISIGVKGSDRSYVVKRADWEVPFVVQTGTPLGQAIYDILQSRFPGVPVNIPLMTGATWKAVFDGADGDPWQDAMKLANAGGYEIYFDGDGVVVAQKPATGEELSVVTYEEGEDAILLSLDRSVTATAGTYNAVIAVSENSELAQPLRSFVYDDNPESPTYYFGSFGKVHRKWSSQFITTQAQLDAAAKTMLNLSLGSSEQVDIESLVNPAIEPNDVISIVSPNAGIDHSKMIVDSVKIGMSPNESQTLQGRKRFF